MGPKNWRGPGHGSVERGDEDEDEDADENADQENEEEEVTEQEEKVVEEAVAAAGGGGGAEGKASGGTRRGFAGTLVTRGVGVAAPLATSAPPTWSRGAGAGLPPLFVPRGSYEFCDTQ